MSYYGTDVDVEQGDDTEIEIEIENGSPERDLIRERGQQFLQDLEPGRVRSLFGG